MFSLCWKTILIITKNGLKKDVTQMRKSQLEVLKFMQTELWEVEELVC